MAIPSPLSDDIEVYVGPTTVAQKLKANPPAHTTSAISAFDARLLNGASRGMSPNELSRSIGGTLSPAECAVRVREMLADKNFWTDPERKQLLLHRVHKAVDDLFEIAENSKDAQDYSAVIRALDLLRKTLADTDGATEAELMTLVRLQAGAMIEYVETIMARAKEILGEEYPDLDLNVIEDAFETAAQDVRSSS